MLWIREEEEEEQGFIASNKRRENAGILSVALVIRAIVRNLVSSGFHVPVCNVIRH